MLVPRVTEVLPLSKPPKKEPLNSTPVLPVFENLLNAVIPKPPESVRLPIFCVTEKLNPRLLLWLPKFKLTPAFISG